MTKSQIARPQSLLATWLLTGCLFFTLSSCVQTADIDDSTAASADPFPYSKASYYFKTTSEVHIEIYYEPNAAPFTGTVAGGKDIMSVFGDNLTDIFQYRSTPPTLNYPVSLEQMTELAPQNKSSWSVDDVMALNAQYTNKTPSATEAVFYIYFLDGYSDSGQGIIGFSINGTPIIAIFKQVITSVGAPLTRKYVEQSTLIHEMGHALGFVANGVPDTSAHQDVANGAHTTNSNCVMYWQNEGVTDLLPFINQVIDTGSFLMWGDEVKADAEAYSE